MECERVTAKTEEQFIREVALDCVANMKVETKEYIRDNPYLIDYHFGYALYIRNHYIHCRDFSDVDFWADPDHLSSCIMTYIFSLLLPGEYIYDDVFIEQLFDHKEFIRIRKGYRKIYGGYPVEIIQKYRKHVPVNKLRMESLSKEEMRKLPNLDFKTEMEISRRDSESREKVILELISELAESVWRVDGISATAIECGIDPALLEDKIKEIKDIFFNNKEYIPMEVVLLPHREKIGEERYIRCRELLCAELDNRPSLMNKLDKVCFKDREIAKTVLKYAFAMEQLPEYQNDDEMVRYALEHNGNAIQYVNERYLRDRDWVRFAIEHSQNSTIMFPKCMKYYRSDKEFVYLACKTHKSNFAYVDEAFHDDYDLAYIVISDNDGINNVFEYLSERLKDDLSLALIDAAGQYPDVKEYSERLRDNDQVAEQLIKVHGIDSRGFGYMSDRIKKKYGYADD